MQQSSSIVKCVALMKIVSDGQSGVDRGALDAALVAGFPCGGWCPPNREAEDGPIPERYPLTPLLGEDIGAQRSNDNGASAAPTARQVAQRYRAGTLKNVKDSVGTVILFSGTLSGGMLLTRNLCVREKKPLVALDSKLITALRAADAIGRFVDENDIYVLNVAGPRASVWPEGYAFSLRVIGEVIARVGD